MGRTYTSSGASPPGPDNVRPGSDESLGGSFSEPAIRILLVDDDDDQLKEAAELLQHLGHIVTSLSSPLDLLALDRLDGYDVLLSDIQMPEMSGLELAARVCDRHPALRIILMSGAAPDMARMREHWSFCPKPLDPGMLRCLIGGGRAACPDIDSPNLRWRITIR